MVVEKVVPYVEPRMVPDGFEPFCRWWLDVDGSLVVSVSIRPADGNGSSLGCLAYPTRCTLCDDGLREDDEPTDEEYGRQLRQEEKELDEPVFLSAL